MRSKARSRSPVSRSSRAVCSSGLNQLAPSIIDWYSPVIRPPWRVLPRYLRLRYGSSSSRRRSACSGWRVIASSRSPRAWSIRPLRACHTPRIRSAGALSGFSRSSSSSSAPGSGRVSSRGSALAPPSIMASASRSWDSSSPGANDVDLGPRTMTSPALSLNYGNAEVRYSYWAYSSATNDDLVVELSTNGSLWVTARTHRAGIGGWNEGKVDVGSYLTPGATTFVRFRISDTPNDSITEAAIDDVSVSVLLPSGCSLPAVFCVPKIDSNFCIPRIGFDGYPSLGSSQPFTLDMSSASGQRNGLLFYGYGAQLVPFQGGALCVLQPLRRTQVQSTGGTALTCDGTMSFDFGAHASSGADALLVPGQACAAQYYYRDPLDQFGTALSNAVSFTICP